MLPERGGQCFKRFFLARRRGRPVRDTTESTSGKDSTMRSTSVLIRLEDSREMFRAAPLSAPLRCSINNVKLSYRLVGDMIDISREVFDDLERVNRERRERSELFDG